MKSLLQIDTTITKKIDFSKARLLDVHDRMTVSGPERTAIISLPIRGCSYRCLHCTMWRTVGEAVEVSAVASERAITQLIEILQQNQEVQTAKVFVGGNIFYGSWEDDRGELHEKFWELLPEALAQTTVKVFEAELRLDEFSDQGGRQYQKSRIRETILELNHNLKKVGIELRLNLAIEYLSAEIIRGQGKFPAHLVASDELTKEHAQHAFAWCKRNDIPFLTYTMLGGKLPDRPLTKREALQSAYETTLFALEEGAREAIINSQYLDIIQQREAAASTIWPYVPSGEDMLELIRQLAPHLEANRRVRLDPDMEDMVEGTVGPSIDRETKQWIYRWNLAVDQTKL